MKVSRSAQTPALGAAIAGAVVAGAEEVDMVINYSALRSGLEELVDADVRAVVGACGYAAQRLGRAPITSRPLPAWAPAGRRWRM